MNKYNETEKVLLLKKYIESGMSYCSFARNHNIPVSSFSFMLQEYGHPDVSSILELMKKVNLPFVRCVGKGPSTAGSLIN